MACDFVITALQEKSNQCPVMFSGKEISSNNPLPKKITFLSLCLLSFVLIISASIVWLASTCIPE